MRCYRSKYPGTYIYASSQSASVHWGTFSIVEAEMNCLTDLLASGRTWSYATNMAGSEVMMLTNKEMVANISDNIGEIFVESYPLPGWNQGWIQNRFKYDPGGNEINKGDPENPKNFIVNLGENEVPVPFNLSVYKGAKSWAAPRRFVDFVLNHPVALEFIGKPKYRSSELELMIYKFRLDEGDLCSR